MQGVLDQQPYTLKELQARQVLMHLDGEGCVPPTKLLSMSYVNPLLTLQDDFASASRTEEALPHSWLAGLLPSARTQVSA